MKKLIEPVIANWKIISLTFEVFWVAVFLLHAATSSSGSEVTEFVYANF